MVTKEQIEEKFAELLKGTGILVEVRSGACGEEIRLTYQQYGLIKVSHPRADESTLAEVEYMISRIRDGLALAAAGRLK